MQNIMKLQKTLRLIIYEGEKAYRAYSYRINDLVVCKTNRTFQRGVRREPMAMGGHVASGTCVSNPVSTCIQYKGGIGVCKVERTRISSKLC